jgi:hypothetical protein
VTLRGDLTGLMADFGITDVDIDEAVADEHVRSAMYRRIVAEVAAAERRDKDRETIGRILRDPEELTSKTAFVDFVDNIAWRTTDPAEFEEWATGIAAEIDLLEAEGNRRFLRRRIRDWTIYLAMKAGHLPTQDELVEATDWMQCRIAEESTSLAVLTLLAEIGSTKKIRNVARNQAKSRAVSTNTDSAS